MENKTNKGLVWLVVILIVLVVALMGFIVYREFYSEEKTSVDNTTNTTTNHKQELSESEQKVLAEKYFDIFTSGYEDFCDGVEFIPNNLTKVTRDNVSSKYKSNIIYWYLSDNKMIESSNEIVIEDDKTDLHKLSKDDVNNISLKLFGIKEHNFKEDELGWVSLEKTTNEYYLMSVKVGGCENFVFGNELKNYEFSEDKLRLIVSKYTYETDSETDEKLDETYKSEEYIITLVKNNNDYVFESIEKK